MENCLCVGILLYCLTNLVETSINELMTQSTRILPDNYRLTQEINLLKDTKLAIWLNVIAMAMLIPVIAGLVLFVKATHPENTGNIIRIVFSPQSVLFVLALLAAIIITLLFHEAIHGIFFLIFTHSRPVFAIRYAYAYAAAPGWFIPAVAYVLVGLSPLILIDFLSLVLLASCPPGWILVWSCVMAINTTGAVGDLYIIGNLLRYSSNCLVLDTGDAVQYYVPTI
jgi:hypothetical protein